MPLDELSLFFPCLNEEANIEKVIRQAVRVAPQVAGRYEVIVVDDGSTDRTAEVAGRFSSVGVRVVRHAERHGYGAALRSGFRAARYDWVFFSDGDGQFDLAELPKLVELAAPGQVAAGDQYGQPLRPEGVGARADIVSGYRARRADPLPRLINARLFELALRLIIGLHVRDVNCAFKLFRRKIFDEIELTSTGAMINAEIFIKARQKGYTIAYLPVSHHPRQAGRQTGAQPSVIFQAMREFWALRREFPQRHA